MTDEGILLFHFATSLEAGPFLEAVSARSLAVAPFPLHRFPLPDGGEAQALLSGMGPDLARAGLDALTQPVRLVVNAGIAGSLSPRLPVGALAHVSHAARVMEDLPPEQWHPARAAPWSDLPRARLLTLSQALFHPERRRILSEFGDLVDMEGAAVAEWCAEAGVPLVMLKAVSDRAGREAKEELRTNLPGLARLLGRRLHAALPALAAWSRS